MFQAGEHHLLFQNLLIYPDDLVGKLFSLVQQQVVELKPFLLVSFYKENYVFGLVGIHSHFLSQNLTDCSNSEAQLQSLLICLTEILRVTGRHGLDCLLDLLRFFCFSFSLLVVSSIGTNWIPLLPIRVHKDPLGLIRTHQNQLVHIGFHQYPLGSIRTTHDPLRPVGIHLDPSWWDPDGYRWIRMGLLYPDESRWVWMGLDGS